MTKQQISLIAVGVLVVGAGAVFAASGTSKVKDTTSTTVEPQVSTSVEPTAPVANTPSATPDATPTATRPGATATPAPTVDPTPYPTPINGAGTYIAPAEPQPAPFSGH